ncbi:MAG: histidinol-phosphate transaminase [Deltaproteobacteria bacterium]|nr:histidinol-phosphate transaminase [Deltaproteobacteria bacterium]
MIKDLVPREIRDLSAYRPPEGGFGIRLDANESPFPLPPDVQTKVDSAFRQVLSNRYPDPSSRRPREAFSCLFGCGPEEVLAGNGSDELISLILWTFRNTRDTSRPRILIPVPTFSMYSIAARAAGYDVAGVPLQRDLTLDRAAFLSEIAGTDPGIIFLSNPNNPTGSFFGKEDIDAILGASRGLVVVDEAYGDFSEENSWASRIGDYGNLAVLRTLSKVGAAALRCGFLVANPSLIGEINKVRSPFNVNAFTQAAAEVILEEFTGIREQISTVVKERVRVAGILKECGLEVFPSRANFLFVRAGDREEALWTFLKLHDIVVKFIAGNQVTGDALRVTIGTRAQNDMLAEKVKDFFREGDRG